MRLLDRLIKDMSEAKRRATRNKAYMLGYNAARGGRDCLNPYQEGSGSGAYDAYLNGWLCGALGGRPKLERDPMILNIRSR